jgi:hypothetical protein
MKSLGNSFLERGGFGFIKVRLTPAPAADESTTGPAYLMLTDPDGNPILIDQHVPSPKK